MRRVSYPAALLNVLCRLALRLHRTDDATVPDQSARHPGVARKEST
jgi:hypothetical protein